MEALKTIKILEPKGRYSRKQIIILLIKEN